MAGGDARRGRLSIPRSGRMRSRTERSAPRASPRPGPDLVVDPLVPPLSALDTAMYDFPDRPILVMIHLRLNANAPALLLRGRRSGRIRCCSQ